MRSSTNANTVAVAKMTVERGWRVNKKCLCVVLGLIRRSRIRRKNAFWGIPKHKQQVIAYFQTHYDYGPQKKKKKKKKNAFNVGSVKFANSLSPPSIVKKVLTGSKSSQGT